MKRLFSIMLASLSILGAYGQTEMPFSKLLSKWERYQRYLSGEPKTLNLTHFKDSVGVEEMKDAFYKYKDHKFLASPYAGLDSILFIPTFGTRAVILSPLKRYPQKDVRECRATLGGWYGRLFIEDLKDKDGVSRKDLADTLNRNKSRWLDGELITLGSPQWYMGFVVSAVPQLEIYDKGRLIGRDARAFDAPDYFAFTTPIFDGFWNSTCGANLLGALHGVFTSVHQRLPERCFSVLLYENPRPRGKKPIYTLELLEPKAADKETMELFKDFRRFVESIPEMAFRPYYTTDFRIMTGRYYRVTVNKCGWLVEDYFELNRNRAFDD